VILFLYEHAVAFVRVVDEITPRGYRMPLGFNALLEKIVIKMPETRYYLWEGY